MVTYVGAASQNAIRVMQGSLASPNLEKAALVPYPMRGVGKHIKGWCSRYRRIFLGWCLFVRNIWVDLATLRSRITEAKQSPVVAGWRCLVPDKLVFSFGFEIR